MRRPSSVRMGMFWRFGSTEERRPVEATACWNVVCSLPVCGSMSSGQGFDIRRAELRVHAPLQEQGHHGVGIAQLLQHLRVRGKARLRAAAARQVQLVEEDLLELARAAQVDLVAHGGMDVLGQPVDGLAERARQSGEHRAIEGDAGGLHVRQDGCQRQLQLVEDAPQARLGHERSLEGLLRRSHRDRLDGGLGPGRPARRAQEG